MRDRFSAKNVLATVALFLSLTGTSYAATVVIGTANIRKASITNADVKFGQISSSRFTAAARTALKRQGPTGPVGPVGPQGPRGNTGLKGLTGAPAPRAFSYIEATDNYSRIKAPTVNPGTIPCDSGDAEQNCLNGGSIFVRWMDDCTAPIRHYCNLNTGFSGSPTPLSSSYQSVMDFTTEGSENGGFLSLSGPGNIVVTGTATFWHPRGDTHTRIACVPQARLSTAAQNQTVTLGVPTMVSAGDDVINGVSGDQLVDVTVSGAAIFPTAGDYVFQVSCKQLDENNTGDQLDDWWFVKGNVNAVSTEQ